MSKGPKSPLDPPGDHDAILKAVGARLREARLQAGLTQAELGLKADLRQSYVFELESGVKNLSLRTLARMADVFELDLRELLPETRPAPPSAMSLSLLRAAFERVASLLADRHALDARLQAQQAELLTKMECFADLVRSLERKPEPPQSAPEEAAPEPVPRRLRPPGTAPDRN